MPVLERIKYRPSLDDLTPGEARYIEKHFDAHAAEVVANDETIHWDDIDEVEVVVAPRLGGPAGWVVRYVVHGNQRYHEGIYMGPAEVVLPNVTYRVAQFVVQTIAYYAPRPVRYKGVEGLSPVAE